VKIKSDVFFLYKEN